MVAAATMAVAVMRTNTDEDTPAAVAGRPDVVEHLIPPNGTQQQRQSELGIDLAPGYEGALSVNGVSIPTDELRLVPEQNQVFFTPGRTRPSRSSTPARCASSPSCGDRPTAAAAPTRPSAGASTSSSGTPPSSDT